MVQQGTWSAATEANPGASSFVTDKKTQHKSPNTQRNLFQLWRQSSPQTVYKAQRQGKKLNRTGQAIVSTKTDQPISFKSRTLVKPDWSPTKDGKNHRYITVCALIVKVGLCLAPLVLLLAYCQLC